MAGCATKASIPAPSASPLVGRWRQVAIATANQSAHCPSTLPLPGGATTSCSSNDVIEFRPDGTFVATFGGSPVKGSGTWRLSGNNLDLAFTAPPGVAGTSRSTSIELTDGGKTLIIKAQLGEIPTTETYARQ
jgi:hypothetical protein